MVIYEGNKLPVYGNVQFNYHITTGNKKTMIKKYNKITIQMKYKFLYLFLPLCLLASCSGENGELDYGEPASGDKIRFELGFASESVLKLSTDADFRSAWETGDKVGLYIVKGDGGLQAAGNFVDNLELVFDGTSWNYTLPQGKEYYPNDGDSLSFYAYYPYDAAISDSKAYIFGVKSDQFTSGGYEASDLLLAKAEDVSRWENPVRLQFYHALALVQVEVEREVNMPAFDEDFRVRLTDARQEARLNWQDLPVGEGSRTDIIMHRVDGMKNTYRALVPAQTLDAESKITFTQATAGKEINMQYEAINSAPLTAGKAHKYKISLKPYGVDPEHAYAVGDVYPHTGPALGIVYETSNDGKNGKIVSLDEAGGLAWANHIADHGASDIHNGINNIYDIARYIENTNYGWDDFPVFNWVHSKNDKQEDYGNPDAKGIWYLPASDEGRMFSDSYNNYGSTLFNTHLTDAGGTALAPFDYLHSSTVYNNNETYRWMVANPTTARTNPKTTNQRARCFMNF